MRRRIARVERARERRREERERERLARNWDTPFAYKSVQSVEWMESRGKLKRWPVWNAKLSWITESVTTRYFFLNNFKNWIVKIATNEVVNEIRNNFFALFSSIPVSNEQVETEGWTKRRRRAWTRGRGEGESYGSASTESQMSCKTRLSIFRMHY